MKTITLLLLTLSAAMQLGPLRLRNAWLRFQIRRLRRQAARVAVRRAFHETQHLPPCLR
jgi:hypothetical protein